MQQQKIKLTGGVLCDRSLFSLSVNPLSKEFPPTATTLLYRPYRHGNMNQMDGLTAIAPTCTIHLHETNHDDILIHFK